MTLFPEACPRQGTQAAYAHMPASALRVYRPHGLHDRPTNRLRRGIFPAVAPNRDQLFFLFIS